MTIAPPTIRVDSRVHWNDTGLDVVQGARYRVTVSGTWRDASHECGPEGWPGTPVVNLFTFLRRAPDFPWFALVASVGRQEPYVHVLPDRLFIVPSSGRLYCFANDAFGFYGNNQGTLQLELEEMARGQGPR